MGLHLQANKIIDTDSGTWCNPSSKFWSETKQFLILNRLVASKTCHQRKYLFYPVPFMYVYFSEISLVNNNNKKYLNRHQFSLKFIKKKDYDIV